MRSFNYVPIFPILWGAYCALNIITNYDYYMRSQEGRLLLLLFSVMILLCVILALYLIKPKFLVRAIGRIAPGRYCPHCHEKMAKGSHFCAKCGTIIDGSSECTALVKCGHCGERVSDMDQEFCPRCGNILKK